MHVRVSLCYVVAYLLASGIGLLVAPQATLAAARFAFSAGQSTFNARVEVAAL